MDDIKVHDTQTVDVLEVQGPRIVLGDFKENTEIMDLIDWDEASSPTIVVGPLPPPEVIRVDLRPALEQIGADVNFKISRQYGGIHVTQVRLPGLESQDVEIGSEYYAVILEGQVGGATLRRVAVMEKNVTGDYSMEGYVDITEQENVAMACSSVYKDIRRVLEGPVPDYVEAIGKDQDRVGINVAVWVDPEQRGKGLGRVIWTLACAVNELRGMERMRIRGDLTEGQRPDRPGGSFYRHLGASPALFTDPDLWDGNVLKTSVSVDLSSPTTLTERQVRYLGYKLGKDV